MADLRGAPTATVGGIADLRDTAGEAEAPPVCAVAVSQDTLREAIKHASADLDDPTIRALGNLFDGAFPEGGDLLIARMPSFEDARERMDRLAAMLTPDTIPQPVELLQARRNAAMRRDMLAQYGYYTAEDLADLHGSRAQNRHATATRWNREGRIFGVPLGARTVFPAFQIDADGAPYLIVAEVLDALPREAMSPWAVGLWWYADNAWLPGEAGPAELIGGPEEDRIVEAARRLAEPLPL